MNRLFAAVSAIALLASFDADAGPISGYPAATTPLVGTETAIGTQGASTVQITANSIAALSWAGVVGDCTISTLGNITCTATKGNLSVGGNLSVAGIATITGNLSSGNLSTGSVSATGTGAFTGNLSGGNLSTGGGLTTTGNATINGGVIQVGASPNFLANGNGVVLGGGYTEITNGGGSFISYFSTPASGTIHLGQADVAGPSSQILGVQGVVTGTTNGAGANFTIAGSQSTGSGAGGSILFQTTPAAGSGNTTNAEVTAMTIDSLAHRITGGSAPTCSTNCASVTGTDTRMKITGNASVTTVAILFNKTWAATPVCNVTSGVAASGNPALTTLSTGGLTVTVTSSTPILYVSCEQ